MTTRITPAPAYQRPTGKLYLSANQLNLVSGVITLVELDAISANFTDGIEDTANHKITPGIAGFYDVKGQVTFTSVIADKIYNVYLRLNGVTTKVGLYRHSSIAAFLTISCTVLLYLSATDYLTLFARSNAGVDTVDVLGQEIYTFLSVQRVR